MVDTAPAVAATITETPAAAEETPVQSLMERLRARFEANPPTDDDTQPTGEPPATPEGTEATQAEGKPPEKSEGEKPAEKKQEPDELAHARTLDKLKKTTADNVALVKRAETAETELKTIKTSATANPLKLIEKLAGLTLQEIVARGAKGEFDDRTPKLSPEIQEQLDYVKQLRAREAKREAEEARSKDRVGALPKVKQFLADAADKYPILAAFEDSPELLIDMVYEQMDAGKQPTLHEICASLDQHGTQTATEFLSNKKLVAHLAKDPSIRSALLEALGLAKQNAAGPASSTEGKPRPGTAPRTLATSTEVPTRTARDLTDDEERAESIRLLRHAREAGLITL